MGQRWRQGEHVLLLGQTGSGKTYLSHPLLAIRDYVCVIATKRHDDTLNRFRHVEPRYHVRRTWPPDNDQQRVVIWISANDLDRESINKQVTAIYKVLNSIYHDGGWCVFVDDTGYASGTLKLSGAITVLFNQGRSSGISVVAAVTQPSSVAARVPSETLRQVRHVVIFFYESDPDVEGIARIIGKNPRVVRELMDHLQTYDDGSTDFLYYDRKSRGVLVVRNTGLEE